MGCDTLVALGTVTADGVTLFAKNSDRPPRECQRLLGMDLVRLGLERSRSAAATSS